MRCSSIPSARTSAKRRSGAWIRDERLKVLDAEGIDAVVLYTTVGLLWEAELDDRRALAGVHARVQPVDLRVLRGQRRLVPTAHLSLSDPEAAARGARARGRRGRAWRVRRAVHPRRAPARSPEQRSGVRGRAGSRRAVRDPPDVRAAVDEGRADGRVGAREAAAAARVGARPPTACASSSRRCSTTASSTSSRA